MSDNISSRYAVAVLDDLFFASKIREAAKSAGVDVDFVKGWDGIVGILESKAPSLVIVDLNCKNVDTIGLIRKIKESEYLKGVHVIGYLSHVEKDLKRKARDAGYDTVVPRSWFSMHVREMFSDFSRGNYRATETGQ